MLHNLSVLANTFWTLCLLQLKPQDLPASRVFTVVSLLSLLTAYTFVLTLQSGDFLDALAFGLTQLMLLIFVLGSLLSMVGYLSRLDQTLTAFAGTGIVMLLLHVPVLILTQGQEPQHLGLVLAVLWQLVLAIWGIVIDAHILRHALSSPFRIGFSVALLVNVIMLTVLTALFPK